VDWQTGFLVAHALAAPGWLALLFLKPHQSVRVARVTAAFLSAAYLLIFIWSSPAAGVLAEDYSLRGIGRFFDEPSLQLLGWVHYLAFDMWVASWEAEEAARLGLSRWLLLPCLILTIMLGPLGLLLFLALRRRAAKDGAGTADHFAIAS